jgi:hypothetical protein
LELVRGDVVGFQVAEVAPAAACSEDLVLAYLDASAFLAPSLDSAVLAAAVWVAEGALRAALAVCAELELVPRGRAQREVALEARAALGRDRAVLAHGAAAA